MECKSKKRGYYKRILRKITKKTLKGRGCVMERKLTRMANIIVMIFLMIFSYYNVEANAETQLPQNYGAKGALQDSSITLEEALTYAI